MPSDRISVESFSLGNVLKTYEPRVPSLQRSYSWEKANWEDLWGDLTDAFQRYLDANYTYFMGTIVFENDDSFEILDGQQRIATLTILIRAIINSLKSIDPDSARDAEGESILRRQPGKPPTFYLTLNQYDASFFRRVVQEHTLDRADYKSHKLIQGALTFFSLKLAERAERMQSEYASWLGEFYRFILDRIQFACVVSPSRYSFDVFRVLNDRGKGLSQLDLFRTMILHQAPISERDRIAHEWTRVLDLEEPARPDDLLRYYWISRKGDIKARSLFRDIEHAIKSKSVSAGELIEELFFYADFYGDLCSAKSSSLKLKKLLSDVLALGAKQLYPMILAAQWVQGASAKVTDKDVEALATLGLNLFVRHNVFIGLETYKLEACLYEAAKLIRSTEGLAAARGLILDYAEKAVPDDLFGEAFRRATIERHEVAKYILREIEMENRDSSEIDVIRSGAIHLEHIYPQKPEEGSRWDDHDAWVYRLGNMTLLSGKKNSGLGNRAFDKKLSTYMSSEIVMTRELSKLSEWSPVAVEDRQEAWVPTALARWKLV